MKTVPEEVPAPGRTRIPDRDQAPDELPRADPRRTDLPPAALLPDDPAPAPPAVPEPSTRWLSWGLTTEHGGLSDIAGYLAYAAFADGREPHAFSVPVKSFKKGVWRLPEGGRVLRSFESRDFASQVVVGDGWTLQLVRWHTRAGAANVTAVTPGLAEEIARQAARLVTKRIKADEGTVRMGFWHHANVAQRRVRAIEASPWEKIRRNYAQGVAAQLEQVMTVTPQDVAGRLLLLHGPPGTGKTSALRSLGLAWQSWCRIDCVLDPERLFANPGYLLQVVMGADHAGPSTDGRKWRLLILEDCDELVRGSAKEATGQALSRLLNLTDGLLGQGQNVLVAITTNEELGRLHPAVVRPGRCLAQIEVGPLSQDEATAWLDERDGDRDVAAGEGVAADVGAKSGGVTGSATLAELYALKAGRKAAVGSAGPRASTGLYM
jgi:Domain of unknown function (DUF5925)/ATPase family associated with various cellular activities (AAA)